MDIKSSNDTVNTNKANLKRVLSDDNVQTNSIKKSCSDKDTLKQERVTNIEQEIDLSEGSPSTQIRSKPPYIDTENSNLVFQNIDVDYTVENEFEGGLPKPIIRIFGVTDTGHSLVAYVRNFEPYFYVRVFGDKMSSENEVKRFSDLLNLHLKQSTKTETKRISKNTNTENDETMNTNNNKSSRLVTKIQVVEKRSIRGYSFDKHQLFYKIYLLYPSLVATSRRIITSHSDFARLNILTTYESNIPFALRFMIDKDIRGGGQIEIEASYYTCHVYDKHRRLDDTNTKFYKRSLSLPKSHCQIEVFVDQSKIIARNDLCDRQLRIAPIRILSFDIECAGRKGHFPEAKNDPVIQIANQVSVHGSSQPIIRNVFVLGTCNDIADSQVRCYETESELLMEQAKFVRLVDPDILTGYNIINFDLPYLISRASVLNLVDFPYLGRVVDSRTKVKDSTFNSRAYGKRESKDILIEGRIQFDLLPVVQREYKLRSYSLNAVSAHFLKQQKENVHHSIISDLFYGTPEDRCRLAIYCIKDAVLPQRLLDKLMLLVNYVEMARVTGVPISYLLTRGQQIKVVSQLYRFANQYNYVIPVSERQGSNSNQQQYEGATVLEPKVGFYREPIATLDFSSLYPSIMIAHNLCYTTLLDKNEARNKLKLNEDYTQTPNGDCFVKRHLCHGILPEILEQLLLARKRAKNDLKSATDPFLKAILNGRQLALKISANSVYGFTGATVGSLPCLEISSSVTSFGRQMIDQTKNQIEQEYSLANGYTHDAEVVYGDTDSVMVRFGTEDVSESMKLGCEAAKKVSAMFIKPISLEFEKVYKPYLLMAKKRYAGMLQTDPKNFSYMDAKGIETVRRDNCDLVKDVVQNCLNKLLIDCDLEGAVNYAKLIISRLLQNKIDMSQLVITKSLGKSSDSNEYKAKMAHVELAKRMAERDPGNAPCVGDRIAYVIIRGLAKTPQYMKAEDPIYVLEHGLPIDTKHYLDHQLKLPLERIFSPILKDLNSIFAGEHTRSVKVSTSSTGALMKFVVVSKKCLGCKNLLQSNEKDICSYCEPKRPQIYIKQVRKVAEYERKFNEYQVECQRCQETLHREVICSNRDCPIFYRRTKAIKDLESAQEHLDRFTF